MAHSVSVVNDRATKIVELDQNREKAIGSRIQLKFIGFLFIVCGEDGHWALGP